MSSVTYDGFPPSPRRVEEILLEEAERAMNRAVHITLTEVLRRMERHRRTGHMMRGTTFRVQRLGKMVVGVIGNNVFYTPFLEKGTGLYGPRNRWIVPIRARALRFPEPGNKGFTLAGRQRVRGGAPDARARWVYAKRVRGIRPHRMFADSAHVTQPTVEREFQRGAERASQRIAAAWRGGSR